MALPVHAAPPVALPLPMGYAPAPLGPGLRAVTSLLGGNAPSALADRAPAMAFPPKAGSGGKMKSNDAPPLRIQRASRDEANPRAETQTAQAKRDALPNTAERGLEASEIMLLANEVHTMIKRRLALEGERMGVRR